MEVPLSDVWNLTLCIEVQPSVPKSMWGRPECSFMSVCALVPLSALTLSCESPVKLPYWLIVVDGSRELYHYLNGKIDHNDHRHRHKTAEHHELS